MATYEPETGPELWRIALWDCLEGISTQSFGSVLQNNLTVQFVSAPTRSHAEPLESLSNYDDDHNDDFKTTIGLMTKTTAVHVHDAS